MHSWLSSLWRRFFVYQVRINKLDPSQWIVLEISNHAIQELRVVEFQKQKTWTEIKINGMAVMAKHITNRVELC